MTEYHVESRTRLRRRQSRRRAIPSLSELLNVDRQLEEFTRLRQTHGNRRDSFGRLLSDYSNTEMAANLRTYRMQFDIIGKYPDFMRKVGPDIYGGMFRANSELLAQHIDVLKPGSSRGYLYQLLASAGWTSWLWLPQIKLPVLIIMGDDDPIVPEMNGWILANRLPNVRLEVVECGHLFILAQPEMTVNMVKRFIHDNQPVESA